MAGLVDMEMPGTAILVTLFARGTGTIQQWMVRLSSARLPASSIDLYY